MSVVALKLFGIKYNSLLHLDQLPVPAFGICNVEIVDADLSVKKLPKISYTYLLISVQENIVAFCKFLNRFTVKM